MNTHCSLLRNCAATNDMETTNLGRKTKAVSRDIQSAVSATFGFTPPTSSMIIADLATNGALFVIVGLKVAIHNITSITTH